MAPYQNAALVSTSQLVVSIPRSNVDVNNSYLLASTRYYDGSPELKAGNLPPNNTTAGLAEGLAEAHKAYNVPGCV